MKFSRRILSGYIAFLLIGIHFPVTASTPIDGLPIWWREKHQFNDLIPWTEYFTYTAGYFGPNAFPVPEWRKGRISSFSEIEAAADVYWGNGDQTQDISLQAEYVFIPGHLSVTLFTVLAEHYRLSESTRDARASMNYQGEGYTDLGDVQLSLRFRLLKEGRIRPNIVGEAMLRTASSKREDIKAARYFDAPGYGFRLCFEKNFFLSSNTFLHSVRLVGQGGFLCYQMHQHYQNDMPFYAGMVDLQFKRFSLENGAGGYYGWLDKGDRPFVLRSRLQYSFLKCQVFIQGQYALKDYAPYRIQAGICVKLPPYRL